VFEIMQPDQQANVLARSTGVGARAVREGNVETWPVNFPSQHTQRMLEIQQVIALGLKQIELTGFRSRLGLQELKTLVLVKAKYDSADLEAFKAARPDVGIGL
jgi:hypothetical protein